MVWYGMVVASRGLNNVALLDPLRSVQFSSYEGGFRATETKELSCPAAVQTPAISFKINTENTPRCSHIVTFKFVITFQVIRCKS